MNRPLLSLAIVSAAILASCGPVRTLTPVAKDTEISLQQEFEGTWRMGEGIFHVAFDENNVGRFAAIEWKENEFVTIEGRFNALQSEDDDERGFISIQMEDEAKEGVYLLGAFKFIEPDSILLWEAEPFSRYESLLKDEDETIVGIVKKDSIGKRIVFSDGSKLVRKIDDFGAYFDLEEPIIMTRVIPKSDTD